jgi:hypothetical protein
LQYAAEQEEGKKESFHGVVFNDESSELFVKSQVKRLLGMKTQKIRLGFAGVC